MSRPPDERLDLSGVPCPQNTARALMALAILDEGAVLELLLDDGEPVENVPPALELEGHTVQSRTRTATGWRLTIVRGEE
jgi:sulfite reductase (ferredoxin)